MSSGYECIHVPVKGALMMIKHPIPLIVLGTAAIAVYLAYGIWPFIVLASLIFASIIGLVYLQIRSERPASLQEKVIRVTQKMCQRHPEIPATTDLTVWNGGESVRLFLCAPCAVEAERYITIRQLTTQ